MYVESLASWLDIPIDEVRNGLQHIKKNPAKWKTEMKEDETNYLIQYFDSSRRQLWPLLTSPKHNVFNSFKM